MLLRLMPWHTFGSHYFRVIFVASASLVASTAILFGCAGSDGDKSNSTGGAATNGGSAALGGNTSNGGSTGANQGGSTSLGGAAGSANGGTANGGSASGGSSGYGGVTSAQGGLASSGGASGSGGVSGNAGAAGNAGSNGVGTCAPPSDKTLPLTKLSQTGCVDSANPRQFSARVIPYEVNSPLWSDFADKTRGLVLPPGGKIRVLDCAATPAACAQGTADSGRWLFPVGTVMIKNFLFDDKFVETRLFVHFPDDTWVGYSYAWNEAQTDATIVPEARTSTTFNTGKRSIDWTFPSRRDCNKCHATVAGSVLGPETAQMNRVVGGMNQIDRLQSLGAFETAPAKPYLAALVTPYASQVGMPPANATLEEKARSYLHANCAFCHRPDGDGPSFDVRNAVSFANTQMCDAEPAKGDQGVPGAKILTPGKPETSVLFLRMQTEATNSGRMPPIASAHADMDGVKLIGDWITSIKACP